MFVELVYGDSLFISASYTASASAELLKLVEVVTTKLTVSYLPLRKLIAMLSSPGFGRL